MNKIFYYIGMRKNFKIYNNYFGIHNDLIKKNL